MDVEAEVWDVIVAGAGPSGCAAAIGAARHGAHVLLVERYGHLGGTTVSQGVSVVLSTNGVDLQGVWHEFMATLKRLGGVYEDEFVHDNGEVQGVVDPEIVKFAWDDLLAAAGVTILHHATVSDAVIEHGRVTGVEVLTVAGKRLLRGRRFIDCTGDGMLCHYAGVPWDQGVGESKYAMAATKVMQLGNVDRPDDISDQEFEAIVRRNWQSAVDGAEYSSPLIVTGRVLAYACSWIWSMPRHRRELLLIMSRVLNVDPLSPESLSKAERAGREQMWEVADFYRKYVPGCEDAYIVQSSSHIGIRSSRRVCGLQTVTELDARDFRKYSDSIARSSWDIDIWPADSYTRPPVDRDSAQYASRKARLRSGEYFDIRYGCIVTRDVDNLLVAGRCISAEHVAQSSLRIQQTCMATGQAAGVAAALSLQRNLTPRELDPALVAGTLAKDRASVRPAFAFLDSSTS
jgi:2-polyprenyl-6-methoxyphenol hydroxylase-like FAD-dependent oxidoreductase